MNGRVGKEDTPEGRLAAVAQSLRIQMARKYRSRGNRGPQEPDYADFCEALRPFVQRELVLARIQEARRESADLLTNRIRELAVELAECEKNIPEEYRL